MDVDWRVFHRLVAESAGNSSCWHAEKEARDGVGCYGMTRAEILRFGYGEAALQKNLSRFYDARLQLGIRSQLDPRYRISTASQS